MKQMSSTDTPLGTLNMLQSKQKQTQSPYIVLSGTKLSHQNHGYEIIFFHQKMSNVIIILFMIEVQFQKQKLAKTRSQLWSIYW